jgi:hypothetical protein
MVDLNLLNFQDSLNNQQVMSKFKPSNFGMKFEDILMDILDNRSLYIIKEELLPTQLSIPSQSLKHCDYHKYMITISLIQSFIILINVLNLKNTVIVFIYPVIQKQIFIIKIRMAV